MILQADRTLDRSLQRIGCEALAVAAAVEIATEKTVDIEVMNAAWVSGVTLGEFSPTSGMMSESSYRWLIGNLCERVGRRDMIGDMVADVIDGLIHFYSWWHTTEYTHILERLYLQNGTYHTLLRGKRWQLLYNSVPGLDQGFHRSAHLLWIGPRNEWIRRTA